MFKNIAIIILASIGLLGLVGCYDADDAARDAARVQQTDALMRAQTAQDNLDHALEQAIEETVPMLPVGEDGKELPDPDQQ